MQYLIVIEKTATGYSAYSPDLDGCVTTGATKQEVEQNMREAIEINAQQSGCIRRARGVNDAQRPASASA